MKALLAGLRNIILADPYMIANNITPDKVHTRHISELGNTPPLPCITLTDVGGSPLPWSSFVANRIVQIDIWSQTSYEVVTSLYQDDSTSVINSFGSMRGVNPMFHSQVWTLPPSNITVRLIEVFSANRKEQTANYYNVVIRYKILVIDSRVANIKVN
jgi:hypothetical protein